MGEADLLTVNAIGAEDSIDIEEFEKAIQKKWGDRKKKELKIDLTSLDKIKKFLDAMLGRIHNIISGYELSEITINLSISHTGKVSIILADASLTAAASIGLKIVKKPPQTIATTEETTKTTAPGDKLTTVTKESETTTRIERP